MNDHDPTTELDIRRPRRQWMVAVGLLALLSLGLGASTVSYWLLLRSVRGCSHTVVECAPAPPPGPVVTEERPGERCPERPARRAKAAPLPVPPALKMEDF